MSEAHRRHIERWEPFLARLGAEHVWAATPRDRGRSGSRFYLALKVGAKSYSIVEFDSSAKASESTKTLVADIASPKTVLETFKTYREMAKVERDAARETDSKTDSPKPVAKKTVRKPKVKTA